MRKIRKIALIYAKTFRIFSAFSESFKTIEILDGYESSKVFLFFCDIGKEESHLLIICVNMVLVFIKNETVAIANTCKINFAMQGLGPLKLFQVSFHKVRTI